MKEKGDKLFRKWKRLCSTITGDYVTTWNTVITANSGKQMSEILVIFREVMYVSTYAKKEGAEVVDDDIEDEAEDNATDARAMPPDWYPSCYLPFVQFGPPAAPNDSKIFRAELSNGPAKLRQESEPSVGAQKI